MLIAIGLFFGLIGPFGTGEMSAAVRIIYWLLCIVGGGGIGVAIDAALPRRGRLAHAAPRVAVCTMAMTPLVIAVVLLLNHGFIGDRVAWPSYALLLWQVAIISFVVMGVRHLVHRTTHIRVETKIVVEPPLPEAEAAFRRRLSASRRLSRLIAVEAHDHYLRVHTDRGTELLTMRFADAMAELARAHGFRVHRSWWVSADAIERVRWLKGSGEVSLAGGLTAPASDTSLRPCARRGGDDGRPVTSRYRLPCAGDATASPAKRTISAKARSSIVTAVAA